MHLSKDESNYFKINMFKEDTLLILGAGASHDYGFPTGEELIKNILSTEGTIMVGNSPIRGGNKTNILNSVKKDIEKHFGIIAAIELSYIDKINSSYQRFIKNRYSSDEIIAEVTTGCNAPTDRVVGYISAYIEILGFFHKLEEFDPISIDFFLSLHKEFNIELKDSDSRKGFEFNIGKYAIAHEIHGILFCMEKTINAEKKKGGNSSWYKYILTKLLQDCQREIEEIKHNKLSVITFNYDTSLEVFLKNRLSKMNHFNYETDNGIKNYAEEFVTDFIENNIFHVYGKIELGKDDKENTLEQSQHIDVIDRNNNGDGGKYKKIIEKSRNIYIIGYGFDDANNDLIGLKNVFSIKTGSFNYRSGKYIQDIGLKNNVTLLNHNNSKIINKKIQKYIYDNIMNDKSGVEYFDIDLSRIHNLTITEKPISEAIGSDFDFS